MVELLKLLNAMPQSLVMALQLVIACAVYSPALIKRPHFPVRCGVGLAALLIISSIRTGLSEQQELLTMPLLIYAFFGLFLYMLFELDMKKLCFVFLSVVATQHIAVVLTDTLRAVFSVYEMNAAWYLISFVSFALTLPVCYHFFGKRLRVITQIKMQSSGLIGLSCLLFAIVYFLRVFSLFQIWLLPAGNPLIITINLYGLVGSIASLAILYAGNHEATLVEENQMIEQMLHEREAQEVLTGETIDLVNMKYHDMKHLLAAMRSSEGTEVGGVLDEIERELPQYERVLRTGNAALDTILMNKMVLCQAKEIELSCMVDGAKLSKLSTADIYALFGNLLDNAIEALQEEPPQRRAISLQVFEKRGYLCIHVANYCSNTPELEDGIPKTRKADKRYHGFGIKSIRYIAEKYGGNLTISTEDQQFCVDILI